MSLKPMQDYAAPKDTLDPIEIASRDEISALQLQRLKTTLARAYAHVPHYKAAFDEAGVHPDQVNDLSDLARFPFTVKDHLRQNYPFGMFAVPQNERPREVISDATSEKVKRSHAPANSSWTT